MLVMVAYYMNAHKATELYTKTWWNGFGGIWGWQDELGSQWRCLPPSLTTWVPALGLTRWKESKCFLSYWTWLTSLDVGNFDKHAGNLHHSPIKAVSIDFSLKRFCLSFLSLSLYYPTLPHICFVSLHLVLISQILHIWKCVVCFLFLSPRFFHFM